MFWALLAFLVLAIVVAVVALLTILGNFADELHVSESWLDDHHRRR